MLVAVISCSSFSIRGNVWKSAEVPTFGTSQHHHEKATFTLDWTSALWSFWSRSAADLVSSFRAAICNAGNRTLPLVSFSRRMATAWLCPCCSATARGVKPSYCKNTHCMTLEFMGLSTSTNSVPYFGIQWFVCTCALLWQPLLT